MDAEDLLVHSPQVISKNTQRTYDINFCSIGYRSSPARSVRAGTWWQEACAVSLAVGHARGPGELGCSGDADWRRR
jgi:hypothetical protein